MYVHTIICFKHMLQHYTESEASVNFINENGNDVKRKNNKFVTKTKTKKITKTRTKLELKNNWKTRTKKSEN